MDFELYKNKMTLPTKGFNFALYSKGKVVAVVATREELLAEQIKCPKGISEQYQIDEDQFRESMAAYRREDGRLREVFKQDLFSHYGVNLNPKREALYSKVVERNDNYYDIWEAFGDLVDLIH
jgi:hypothetical protein